LVDAGATVQEIYDLSTYGYNGFPLDASSSPTYTAPTGTSLGFATFAAATDQRVRNANLLASNTSVTEFGIAKLSALPATNAAIISLGTSPGVFLTYVPAVTDGGTPFLAQLNQNPDINPTAISVGTYFDFCAVFNLGGSSYLYVNGVSTGPGSVGTYTSVGGVTLGNNATGTSYPWVGSIVETVVEEDVAFSATQCGNYHSLAVAAGYP
jgi:hypothetical protein